MDLQSDYREFFITGAKGKKTKPLIHLYQKDFRSADWKKAMNTLIQGYTRHVHLIKRAIELSAIADGWALLSQVGLKIKELDPSFRVNKTGHSKLIDLIQSYPNFFEVKVKPGNGKIKHYIVRNIKSSGN